MLLKKLKCTNGTLSRCTNLVLLLVALVSFAFSNSVLAQGQHGIGLVKGCVSPVIVGNPLQCQYTISNTLDTGTGQPGSADTLTIDRLEDFVCNGGIVGGNCLGKNAQPPVPSGDILPLLTLTLNGGATCNPGQTMCTLPPGASISTAFYSHYNVEADDADPLPDRVVLRWQDLNTSGSNNPPVGDQEQFTGSTATINCAPCEDDQCQVCNEQTNVCDNLSNSTACTDTGDECWDAGCFEGACVQQHVPTSASTPCTDTGNECADAGCDGAGTCDQLHTPKSASTVCADTGEECWDAGCDGAGACVQQHVPTSASTPCTDTGEECADAGCDGAGSCDQLHTPKSASTPCTDFGEECWDAGCDGAGLCEQQHVPTSASTPCGDTGEECADAGCDGAGSCDQLHTPKSASTPCEDTGEECADAGCDGAGQCDQLHTPKSASTVCTDTGEECWDAGCDGSGACVQQHVPTSASTPCGDTGEECADAGCDGAGSCDQLHTPLSASTPCTDTGNVCFDAGCDGAGQCDQLHTPGPPCEDPDCESCDPVLGCIPIVPEPPICLPGEDVCRTPGFWKLHAGEEKKNSRNVTQEAIDWAGGSLDVCGIAITNTLAGNANSALEAMCISVEGEQRLQLIRQLTAAALNCAVSGGGPGDCTGITSIEEVYNLCNDACEFEVSEEYTNCIEAIDDWNNGLTGNDCHNQSLCPDFDDDGMINGSAICLEPHGPAGSNKECKDALNTPLVLP